MRHLRWITLVLAAFLSASVVAQQQKPTPPPKASLQINWQGVKGAVARYNVPPGVLIVWVMSDEQPHTVTHRPTEGAPLFDSGILQGAGQWFAHRFDRAGEYVVYDKESPEVSAIIDVR